MEIEFLIVISMDWQSLMVGSLILRFEWYHRLGFPEIRPWDGDWHAGSVSASVWGRGGSRIGQRDKWSCSAILVGASANSTGNSENRLSLWNCQSLKVGAVGRGSPLTGATPLDSWGLAASSTPNSWGVSLSLLSSTARHHPQMGKHVVNRRNAKDVYSSLPRTLIMWHLFPWQHYNTPGAGSWSAKSKALMVWAQRK